MIRRDDDEDIKPDVEAIMARIRERVREELRHGNTAQPTQLFKLKESNQVPLLYSEELNFLNANWQNWITPTEITSHRFLIGPIIVRAKRFLFNFIWKYILKGYFESERQFHMNLVRHLNASARYIEGRDSEIFWELVKKIDHDIAEINTRFDQLFDLGNMTLRATRHELEERIAQLETDRNVLVEIADRTHLDVTEFERTLRAIESSILDLERTRQTHGFPSYYQGDASFQSFGWQSEGAKNGTQPSALDSRLLLAGRRYRRPAEDLKRLLTSFVSHFQGLSYPIVELGCGRGEFLEALREVDVPAFGVEVSEESAQFCRDRGLNAVVANYLEYLEQLGDKSIGGVMAYHLVEHLTQHELERLIKLLAQKVIPGGKVVLETLNPYSLVSMAERLSQLGPDVSLIAQDALTQLLKTNGIRTLTVEMKDPCAGEKTLQTVALPDELPKRWHDAFRSLNDNILRLNNLLFGYESYVVVSLVEADHDVPVARLGHQNTSREARGEVRRDHSTNPG